MCAAFFKESRKKFANANNLDRKSGTFPQERPHFLDFPVQSGRVKML
jgi:hypothetical protein